MNHTGQGNGSPSRNPRWLDDGGYIMVALLIGMAVAAIWMGTMLPAWRTQVQREKESELVYRGEQYARAIALFFRKNQALPLSVDVLVSQHYLRQKYKDPVTGKDFLVIGSSGLAQPGQTGRGGGPVAPGPTQPPGAFSPVAGGVLTGITGVRSTSTERSIRVYQNQQSYSQWPFDYQLAQARMGGQFGPNPNRPPREGGDPTGGGPRRGGPFTPPGGILNPPRGGTPPGGQFPPGRGPAPTQPPIGGPGQRGR